MDQEKILGGRGPSFQKYVDGALVRHTYTRMSFL